MVGGKRVAGSAVRTVGFVCNRLKGLRRRARVVAIFLTCTQQEMVRPVDPASLRDYHQRQRCLFLSTKRPWAIFVDFGRPVHRKCRWFHHRDATKQLRHTMNLNRLRQLVWLSLFMLCGCQNEGFDLELHSPVEVHRVELTIDFASGVAARRVAGHSRKTYAIDLDENGKATIDAAWPISSWHRTFLVTPSGRLQKNYDFQIVDSGWKMAKTVTALREWSPLENQDRWLEVLDED